MSLIQRHFGPVRGWIARQLLRLWPVTRAFALHVFATLTGRKQARVKAQEWDQVWRRRADWQDGFAPD